MTKLNFHPSFRISFKMYDLGPRSEFTQFSSFIAIGQKKNNWPIIFGLWFKPKSYDMRIHMGADVGYKPSFDFPTGWSECSNCSHTVEVTYDDKTGKVVILLDGNSSTRKKHEFTFDRNRLKLENVLKSKEEVRLTFNGLSWDPWSDMEIGQVSFEPL